MRAPLPTNVPTTDEPVSGETVTLLCVENTLAGLELIKLIVDTLRPTWHLLAARDGPEGLRVTREQRPDLILLGLRFSGTNGDDFLVALRTDPATAHIPVLVCSADASRQTRERLLTLGANDYLPKPFSVHTLVDKLEALLRAR